MDEPRGLSGRVYILSRLGGICDKRVMDTAVYDGADGCRIGVPLLGKMMGSLGG